MHYQAVLNTPVGKLGIHTSETHLLEINFLPETTEVKQACNFVAELTCDQLNQYFKDPHWQFELPCDLKLTPYQNKVLDILCLIPVGETRDYTTVAKACQSGPRAVGGVCRINPIPIVIPCHRVIAKSHIGGYGGAVQGPGIIKKQWLLAHEAQNS